MRTATDMAMLCIGFGGFLKKEQSFMYEGCTLHANGEQLFLWDGENDIPIENDLVSSEFIKRLNEENESKDKQNNKDNNNTTTHQHIDVTTLSNEQLSTLISQAVHEQESRVENRFNELVDNVLNAMRVLVEEYPMCSCYVDVEAEDDDVEVDILDLNLNRDMFRR